MRTTRIIDSDAILDKTEQEWWNTNAEIVEKIWAQSDVIQKTIRLPYLSKMKSFFLSDAKSIPVKILEVGCGTGWVCRMIADKDFHVIGTDFSEEQIRIATENSILYNKDKYCTYKLADASTFQEDIDGVVIHGILHHLSKKELSVFFNALSKVPSGTKVFLFEPSFFKAPSRNATIFERILNKIIITIKGIALSLIKKIGKKDDVLYQAMDTIYKDAEKNGWYISPKEVPFQEGELESYLNPNFSLLDKFIVNRTELDIAQSLTFFSIDKNPSFIFTKLFIPVVRFLDNLLLARNFRAFTLTNSHLFLCLAYIKK